VGLGATSPSPRLNGSSLHHTFALATAPAVEADRAEQIANSKAKRFADLALALLALTALAPVFAIIALAMVLDSGRPILYGQKRIGFDRRRGSRRNPRERRFTCWKFRTMVHGADDLRQQLMQRNAAPFPTFKVHGDPRVTRIGRFLRRSSLDELPQLWNVLRGEMSLVGPRPPLPEEVATYDEFALQRLAVRPGVTCLWQVGPRHHEESTFKDWVEKDLEYIRKSSFLTDLAVLSKTVLVVIKMTGE
jgi:lipopolysaccharide/colanic/teichoic acid biosynthesis glycosyltransferase